MLHGLASEDSVRAHSACWAPRIQALRLPGAGAGGVCLPPTQGAGRMLGEFCKLESLSSSMAAPPSWCRAGWHALLASSF